jgi:hypothetical protein
MPLVRRPLARAAIVGGGAYVAGKKRAESQQREADEQQQAPAAEAPQKDVVAKLKELQEMQASGALTPEQFEAAKQKLLQGE